MITGTTMQEALLRAGAVTESDVERVNRQRTIEAERQRKIREKSQRTRERHQLIERVCKHLGEAKADVIRRMLKKGARFSEIGDLLRQELPKDDEELRGEWQRLFPGGN